MNDANCKHQTEKSNQMRSVLFLSLSLSVKSIKELKENVLLNNKFPLSSVAITIVLLLSKLVI